MTRRDWWLGIVLVVAALLIQTFLLLRQLDHIKAEFQPGLRPLASLAADPLR